MGYAREFTFENYHVPAFLQSIDWTDQSYRNDVCPRFENERLLLAVWVECHDRELREYEEWHEYSVVEMKLQSDGTFKLDECTLFETESIQELQSWIQMYEIKQHIDAAIKIANSMVEQPEEIADGLMSTLEWLNTYMIPDGEPK